MTLKKFEKSDEKECRFFFHRVVLVVRDSGTGIPADVMAKLGTPFFTTKDKGSGLGLAVSFSIIERHQAIIHFESSSRGTTVTISFGIEQPHHKIF